MSCIILFLLNLPCVSSSFTNDNVFKGSSECLTSSQTSKFREDDDDDGDEHHRSASRAEGSNCLTFIVAQLMKDEKRALMNWISGVRLY